MVWENGMSVGVASIDEDHRRLLEILNSLLVAFNKSEARDVVESTIKDLVGYSIRHFDTEERLFEAEGYPRSDEHKRMHGFFVDRVSQLGESYDLGNTDLGAEMIEFLQNWLVEHIMGADLEFGEFLKKTP